MNKLLLIIPLIFIQITLKAQYNKNGYPFYTYYNSDDYNAYDQNWDVIEDKDGIIYVANNNDGILQFDGVEWRKIKIENKPEVRALAIDNSGVIFVGCTKDFGYLSPTFNGNLIFKSLLNKFEINNFPFSQIFKINIIKDSVFFKTDNSLLFKYILKEDTVLVSNMPQYSLFTFNINNELYSSSYIEGLFVRVKDTVKVTKGGEFYKSKNIFSVLPVDSSLLKIITWGNGFYNYDTKTGTSVQLLNNNDLSFIKNYNSYAATQFESTTLVATLGTGIISLNNNNEIERVYDEQLSIKDHNCASITILGNSAWSALSMGILRFEYNSPFSYFSKESNLEGFVVGVIKKDNILYVATEIGLFYFTINNDIPEFKKINGIKGQIVEITTMSQLNDNILIGTYDGIYQYNTKSKDLFIIEKKYNLLKVSKTESSSLYVTALLPNKQEENLWVGTKSRLLCLNNKSGKWEMTDKIYTIGDRVNNIIIDSLDNIWATTKQKGIVKIDNSTNKMSFIDTLSGLPAMYSLRLYKHKNKLFCSTPKGIYSFNCKTSKFYKDTIFPEKFINGSHSIDRIVFDNKNNIYINYSSINQKGIDKLEFNKTTGKYRIVNDFKRLGNVDINFFYPDSNLIWFGIGDVLYNYDNSKKINTTLPYKCLIRKVEGIDTVYFNGTFYKETDRGLIPSDIQNEKQKPILRYAQNDITFHFAAPYFEGVEAIKYSYKLVGFKNSWSKWNKEPKAVFTNLNEGEYIFKVKAKNIYGVESEIGNYEFSILPPWYRTTFAYIVYVILAIAVIILIVKIYTRRLEQEKIHLEGIVRERTAEIREQRDQIAEQKQSIEDSILYASRIQRAILPSHDLAQEILPDYFILFRPRDIVSGDYFWMNKIGGKTIVVAADCTGHGVPGAFMSMLGVSFLNEIVLKENIVEPHLILNKLRNRVKKTLKQEGKEGEAKDGMDIALVVFDETQKKLYFSGAYNPVLIYRGEELIEIKADRMPIGIYIKEKESFTLNEFDYQSGDTFYIFSDGYPDQFGGPKGQKFRIKTMKALIASIQDKPMSEQKEILNKTIEEWMAETEGQEQIDDMVVIGVRL